MAFVRSGTSEPSMRSCGGEPVVRWRSEAFFSTIAFRSCWRLMVGALTPVVWVLSSTLASIRRGDAGDFLERAHARAHLADARHAQRAHPLPDGLGLELDGRGALEDELPEAVLHEHDLVDGDAALVAAAVALVAAGALGALGGLDLLVLAAEGAQLVLR